jgi:hypothetical protein
MILTIYSDYFLKRRFTSWYWLWKRVDLQARTDTEGYKTHFRPKNINKCVQNVNDTLTYAFEAQTESENRLSIQYCPISGTAPLCERSQAFNPFVLVVRRIVQRYWQREKPRSTGKQTPFNCHSAQPQTWDRTQASAVRVCRLTDSQVTNGFTTARNSSEKQSTDWPLVPKFASSKRRIFQCEKKNSQHAFLRRGSKPVCPMSHIYGM